MKRFFWIICCGIFCIHLAGCAGWKVRTSTSRKPRVDQEISGNRGFICGKPTTAPSEPTFTDRKVYQVEVEIPQLFPKKEVAAKQKPVPKRPKQDQAVWGNKGYILGQPKKTAIEEPSVTYKVDVEVQKKISSEIETEPRATTTMRTYNVSNGDTLQKISQEFYGTTKKWPLLYNANRDKLKSPDKIKPGQTLVIPEIAEFKK